MQGRLIDDGKVLDDFIEKHRMTAPCWRRCGTLSRPSSAKLTRAEKKQAQTAEGQTDGGAGGCSKSRRRTWRRTKTPPRRTARRNFLSNEPLK